jgi:hypothetical protein
MNITYFKAGSEKVYIQEGFIHHNEPTLRKLI